MQSTPGLAAAREALFEHFKRDNLRLFTEAGQFPPDELVLEGFMAAIDRMVQVESRASGPTVRKVARVKAAAMALVTPRLVQA